MATTKVRAELVDLNESTSESGLKMPSGTELNRPTAAAGQIRNNTNETSAASSSCEEYYNGTEWKRINNVELPIVPSEHFSKVLYDGTSATQSITGVGFKPDLVWIKRTDGTENNYWQDSSRGSTYQMYTNLNSAQFNETTAITSFDSDGFTMGSYNGINNSGESYVAWCWKVNGGTQTTNTDGDITSDVQVNSKAGFSIVQFQTNGNSANRVGHGLSQKPDVVLYKQSSQAANWWWYFTLYDGSFDYVQFNSDGAIQNSSGTAPNSTTIFAESGSSGQNMMAYCFHSVDGYSKFGTYQGNGTQDGPLVETGFEPAFLMVKRLNQTANWRVVDNTRSPFNHRQKILFPNLTNAELDSTDDAVDFLTTGFKISNDDSSWNANADKFLYFAFASDPTAAPTLADSFNTTAYTGNGTSNRQITSLGFNPSWVWIKNRTVARDHMAFDNTRLLGSELVPGFYPNLDAAEFNTTANDFNSFDANGFTVGSDPYTNENGQEMVAWSWKANSIPSINNNGTIQSIVSANANAGFSIVTWTTNGSASQTVGHGLSSTPEVIFFKKRNAAQDWFVETNQIDGTYDYLTLNNTAAAQDGGAAWSTRATSTTITAFTSSNSQQYVAYCFHEVSGFSSFGSYTGTGDAANRPTITTGFEPGFVMIKSASTGGSTPYHWNMYDNKRNTTNPRDKILEADTVDTELTASTTYIDFNATGFQIGPTTSGRNNGSGVTYFYMAFKENPTPYPLAGNMSFLIVGGGAAGGSGNGGSGGGGAGGLKTSYGGSSGGGTSPLSDITLAAGTYTITVGGGGAGVGNVANTVGNDGSDSELSGPSMTTINCDGGGGGGAWQGQDGRTGGSGGGGGAKAAGTGNTSGGAGSAGQGFAGGTGWDGTTPYAGGGGGGASQAGENGGNNSVANGGNGLDVSITGTSVAYAGGGGSGTEVSTYLAEGQGGSGGGGTGGTNTRLATAGTANTGGGGGGGGYPSGFYDNGAGGSGVVVLRLLTSEYSGTTTGSPTVTTDGDYTILKYTGSGTYVHS